MAQDISKSTGSRTSRASRTRSNVQPGSTRPSVGLKRTSRAIHDGTAHAQRMGDLSISMANFFGNTVSQLGQVGIQEARKQQVDNALRVKKNTQDAVTAAQAKILTDPEASRRAVNTGDYSGFLDPESNIDINVATSALQAFQGRRLGSEDASAIQQAIATADQGADLDKVISDFVDQNTKGASDVFVIEYASQVATAANTAIDTRRRAEAQAHTAKQLTEASGLLRERLRDPHNSLSLEGYREFVNMTTATLQMPTVAAREAAEKSIEDALIQAAANGSTNALTILHAKDPKHRDGLSIAMLRKDEVEAAQQAAVLKSRKVQTLQSEAAIQGLTSQIDLHEAGVGNLTVEGLWAGLVAYRDQHGENDKYRSQRKRLLNMTESTSSLYANLDRMAANNAVVFSTKEWNAIGHQIYNGQGLENWMVDNEVGEDLRPHISAQLMGQMGYDTKTKNYVSSVLVAGGDPEEIMVAYQRTRLAASHSRVGAREGHFVDGDAHDIYTFMAAAEDAGQDPFVARQSLLEARQAGFTGTPRRYLETQVGPDGKPRGVAAVLEIQQTVLDGLFDDRSDLLPFNGTSVNDLPLNLREAIRDDINRAAFSLNGLSEDPGKIAALATRRLKDRIGLSMDADGNPVPALDQTPRGLVRDGKGKAVPAVPVTEGYLEAVKEGIDNSPVVQEMVGGSFGGLAQDEMTGLGYGVAVLNENGQRLMVEPGTIIEDFDGNVPKDTPFFRVEANEAGGQLIIAPDPAEVGNRVALAANVEMVFIPEINAWSVRGVDQGDELTIDQALGLPGADEKGEPTPELIAARDTQKHREIAELKARGMIRPGTSEAGELSDVVNSSKRAGHDLDDVSTGPGRQTRQVIIDFQKKTSGGGSTFATSTKSPGVRARRGSGSDIFVASGLFLDDTEAKTILSGLGVDISEVRKGQPLSVRQIERIDAALVDRARAWMKENFSGTVIWEHEQKALVSIMNSGPWKNQNPTIITRAAKTAIRERSWSAFKDAVGPGNGAVQQARRSTEFDYLQD